MDLLLILKSLIMGVVEGITEFLPISSTGHLIITGDLLNFLNKEKRDVYEIFIQLGAILAVCWEYRTKLLHVAGNLHRESRSQRFVINLLIAFVPAGILGKLFGEAIQQKLFNPVMVALSFIIGGLIILWAERRNNHVRVESVDDMTPLDALKVGIAQCFALIPGTSRSGATIIGGMLFGLSRKAATEFSFFLAIPTLTAASLYSLYKHRAALSADDSMLFTVGFAAAFVSAFFAVRALIKYITRHDFTAFAYYRIAFGAVVLLTAYTGWVNWSQ